MSENLFRIQEMQLNRLPTNPECKKDAKQAVAARHMARFPGAGERLFSINKANKGVILYFCQKLSVEFNP
jgi:hypothetical protein